MLEEKRKLETALRERLSLQKKLDNFTQNQETIKQSYRKKIDLIEKDTRDQLNTIKQELRRELTANESDVRGVQQKLQKLNGDIMMLEKALRKSTHNR